VSPESQSGKKNPLERYTRNRHGEGSVKKGFVQGYEKRSAQTAGHKTLCLMARGVQKRGDQETYQAISLIEDGSWNLKKAGASKYTANWKAKGG